MMVSAMCVCADKGIISYVEGSYVSKNKMFSRDLVLPFILCSLIFYGWFLLSVGMNVLSSFSSISIIISFMVVMIGHVRGKTYVLICCAPIRGSFESQYYVTTVGYVDWASLAPDRKVWKAPLNMVMCLLVVYEAGKCMANGATLVGILDK